MVRGRDCAPGLKRSGNGHNDTSVLTILPVLSAYITLITHPLEQTLLATLSSTITPPASLRHTDNTPSQTDLAHYWCYVHCARHAVLPHLLTLTFDHLVQGKLCDKLISNEALTVFVHPIQYKGDNGARGTELKGNLSAYGT